MKEAKDGESPRSDRARTAILKALDNAGEPVGGTRLAQALLETGMDLQPRTIRFHLRQLDERGLTRLVSRRRGRVLTEPGREELAGANVIEKVGFVAARVDTLVYQMSFDSEAARGTVILNTAAIEPADLSRALIEMHAVFDAGFCMGNRLVLGQEGELIAGAPVPHGRVIVGTICSVTVNGILLHEGIPVTSRYGGLLQIKDRKPVRFLELIEYRGTSLDPLEIFIQADMTDVRSVARTGSGRVGASFREVPTVAGEDVRRVAARMRRHGMGSILAMGRPNQPLLGIPVSEGRTGMIVVGGLNPIAAVHEAGVRIASRSLAGLQEFSTLLTIDEVRRRVWRSRRSGGAESGAAPRSAGGSAGASRPDPARPRSNA